MSATVRQLLTAVRAVLVLTVLLGVVYPLVVLGIGRLALTQQAQGSLVVEDGQVVGSALIAQRFDGDQWFQPRPSAGDYDGLASGGTNAGPNDGELAATIEQRRAAIAQRDGVAAEAVPVDALTSSGSGLDPFISPAHAEQQVNRVAAVRNLAPDEVRALVREHTQGRSLGFLGQPRVNVVELNLDLQKLT
jgi:K+-transporting ATPase ATPase C chain